MEYSLISFLRVSSLVRVAYIVVVASVNGVTSTVVVWVVLVSSG